MSKNVIRPQRENRRWIFTSVICIDSIPSGNCLTSFRSLRFIRTGEFESSKTNWKRFVSQEGGSGCRIETEGKGLYLGRASDKGFENVGNGLYLMKQDGLYDGRGLILGPNSLFKISPFLV